MLKLGIYLNTQHPESDDPARRLAETLEQARLIRSLGFDSIWAGEHHATPGFHFFPQLPLLQRVAVEAPGLAIGTNLIDDALARRGLKRDIAMRVPSWLDVHPIVSTTDLVAALPRRWTRTRPFATTCVAKPLPVDEVELAIDAVWHPRHDEDPGHAWIRAAITKAMQQPDEFSRRV